MLAKFTGIFVDKEFWGFNFDSFSSSSSTFEKFDQTL